MRWPTLSQELTRKKKNYLPDPYWFAWRPVVAEDGQGQLIWVWWEYVRRTRHIEKYEGSYGPSKYVYYTYQTLRQQPAQ